MTSAAKTKIVVPTIAQARRRRRRRAEAEGSTRRIRRKASAGARTKARVVTLTLGVARDSVMAVSAVAPRRTSDATRTQTAAVARVVLVLAAGIWPAPRPIKTPK